MFKKKGLFLAGLLSVLLAGLAFAGVGRVTQTSGEANGASAVGTVIDTTASFSTSGAKLMSVRNAGVEKFAIDKDGNVTSSGSTLTSATDLAAFIDNDNSATTNSFTLYKDVTTANSSNVVFKFMEAGTNGFNTNTPFASFNGSSTIGDVGLHIKSAASVASIVLDGSASGNYGAVWFADASENWRILSGGDSLQFQQMSTAGTPAIQYKPLIIDIDTGVRIGDKAPAQSGYALSLYHHEASAGDETLLAVLNARHTSTTAGKPVSRITAKTNGSDMTASYSNIATRNAADNAYVDNVHFKTAGYTQFMKAIELNTTSTATSVSTAGQSVVFVTSTAAARTITLLTADCVVGRVITVVDTSGGALTNNITIDTQGAETINGANSITIITNYGERSLICDGTNWFVIGSL